MKVSQVWWESDPDTPPIDISIITSLHKELYVLLNSHASLIANLRIFLQHDPTEATLRKILSKLWKLYCVPSKKGEPKELLKDFILHNEIMYQGYDTPKNLLEIYCGVSLENGEFFRKLESGSYVPNKNKEEIQSPLLISTDDKEKAEFKIFKLTENIQKLRTEIEKEIQVCIKGIKPISDFYSQSKTTHGLTLNEVGTLFSQGTKDSTKTTYKKGKCEYEFPNSYFIDKKKGEKERQLKLTQSHLFLLVNLLGNIKTQEAQHFDLLEFMKFMGVNLENKNSIYNYTRNIKEMFSDLTQIKVSYNGNGKTTPLYQQKAIFQNSFTINTNNTIDYYLETNFVENMKKFPIQFVLPMGIKKIPPMEKIATQIYLKLYSHFVQNNKKAKEGTLSIQVIGEYCGFKMKGKHKDREVSQVFGTFNKLSDWGILEVIGFKTDTTFFSTMGEVSELPLKTKTDLSIVYVPKDLSFVYSIERLPQKEEEN